MTLSPFHILYLKSQTLITSMNSQNINIDYSTQKSSGDLLLKSNQYDKATLKN